MARKLPKTIYGYWHNDGTQPSDEFLRTNDDPKELVDAGETLRVGVYELQGFVEVKNETRVIPVKTKKG